MTTEEAIRVRVSVRTYRPDPVDPTTMERLRASIRSAVPFFPALGARIELISEPERAGRIFTGLNKVFGRVPHALVGLSLRDPGAYENLAFMEEQVVLEATKLGLGTCWIAGNFNFEEAARMLRATAGEVASNAIAFGDGQSSLYNTVNSSWNLNGSAVVYC
ncbi:hypothetical protein SY88_12990 [Clostridiales bacterium PH28_bin88]|nr:hypothetical protein SY88_12990 [Clostridiales bacterium PH28_bin88]